MVFVAISPAGLQSVAVRREYEYGHAVGRPLLPVVVEKVRLETLPPLLASLQTVDYCEPNVTSAFALAAAIAVLPSPQPLPQPLPEPPPIPISYLSGLKERSEAVTLDMDEQLALVARLKVALGREGDRETAEEVLRSLQNRDDLYQVTAREIESLLSGLNPVPAPPPQQSARESVSRLLAGTWGVNQIVGTETGLVLELRKYGRHVLEYRSYRQRPDALVLDGQRILRMWFSGTKTFEFTDGGQKVMAEITLVSKSSGTVQSFDLKLDHEHVYHFPPAWRPVRSFPAATSVLLAQSESDGLIRARIGR